MKLLSVRIRRGDFRKGEPQLVYPERYDAVEVELEGMSAPSLAGHASIGMSGDIGRGATEEFCIIALPDTLADEYALDPDMEIISETEADTLMEEWRVKNGIPEERITDENRFRMIEAKQKAGIQLSQEDLDALDPEKPVKGINKSRTPVAEKLGTATRNR